MSAKEKKKKSLLRRILKWTGISFAILLILAIITPFIFKNQIKDLLIDEVNKNLNAKLSMGEFDLTFLSTFPNMTIELHDTKLQGIKEFKDVDLVNIKKFKANVGFWSVVSGDQVEIEEIHIDEATFDVRVLQNGLANYDIVKPDSLKKPDDLEEPSNFKLSLKKYSIAKAMIKYDDQPADMYMEIKNLNHTGSGDLTADVVDFETSTNMDKITFDMGGISYLTDVKTDVVANILMEFTDKTSKFTLKENQIKLNALTFSIDGFYEMLEGYDNMDLKLNASKASFKEFLSLIPTFYRSGYESMVSKGNLALSGFVKGKMDDINMPGWDFNMEVDKASIKYPDLPGTINNIAIKAGSRFGGGADLDKMTIDVNKFHADFVGNTIDANLKLRNPETDPLLVSNIIAKMDLSTLGKVVPLSEGESYKGKLDADIHINGRMSALDRGDYEAFKAEGKLAMKEMIYKSKDLKDEIAVHDLLFLFSPKNLKLETMTGKTGKSDFQMNGNIDNYLAYFLRGDMLKGNFTFKSNNLDLDQLMNVSTASEPEAQAEESSTSTEATLIPNNVDFILSTQINNLRYNNMDIKNVQGGVKLKEEIATLDNLTMNTMDGSVRLNGNYNTKNHSKPVVDFAYSLKDIDLTKFSTNFLTIQKLAPISKFAKGKISSNFDMKTALTPEMEPIYSTMSGSGDFRSSMVVISGFKPLQKIADELKMPKLSSQTVKDVNVKFQFKDGKVNVKPFDVNLGKIKTNVSGSTSFEQDIDYDLKMLIPKEEIPAAMIKTVEQALAQISSIAPKLDLKGIPDFIPVKVKVGGTITNPKITNNFKEALMEATGNLKENIKEAVKDTVKAIIEDKIEDIKEDIEAKKQQILNDAQKQADKVKAEAKKTANAVRAEADKQAKALMDQAGSNPLKQKSAELAGNKLKKEAEEKAQKIENEADKKADQIMADARQKADLIK